MNMYNSTDTLNEFNLSVFVSDSFEIEPEFVKIIFIILMSIIFVLSIFANVLTCYVIYIDKSMHTATNYYLFNLAISDLILTCSNILFEFFGQVMVGFPYTEWLCQIQWFSVGCLWNNAVLTVTALAVERYVAIWYPLKLKSTPVWRRVVKIIALLWLVAIAETVPETLMVGLIKSSPTAVCFLIPTPQARVLSGVLAIITFVVPLIIMTVVYSTIVFKVNTRQRNLKHIFYNQRDPSSKINKLMVAMTLSIVVCWLPYFVLRILTAVMDPIKLLQFIVRWGVVIKLVLVNSWFSVVLNPILFSLVSTKFRRALKTLWNAKIRRIAT